MRPVLLAFAAVLLIAACSKVTQENFAKVQDGMAEQEVLALLGPPTYSSSVEILGISGTHLRWDARDAAISIRFVNGKVATKSYHKPDAKKPQ
jgi:hypothetical protein